MFDNSSTKKTNLIFSLIILILIFFEMSFLSSTNIMFTVNISIGFTVGFYICCDKSILPWLLLVTILGRYTGGILFYDFTLLKAIPHTLIYTVYTFLLMFGINFLTTRFDCAFPNSLKYAVKYLLTIVIVTLVSSLIPTMFHLLETNSVFFDEFESFYTPTSSGIIIFTTLIIFSSKYDLILTEYEGKIFPYLLFLFSFALISFAIFQLSFRYDNFIYIAPIMLILFMVHAFLFNFRLLILNSILYISFYSLAIKSHPITNVESLIAIFNVILLSILTVTIISKVLILEMRKHGKNLEDSNRKLEAMMESTFDLFKSQDFIDNAQEGYIDSYLTNIFNILCQLFTKMDSGICVRTKKNDVHILASKAYELKALNSWNLKKDSILWEYSEPIHSLNTKEFYDRILNKDSVLFTETLPSIKESVRFVIPLGNNEFSGFTLEIHDGSKEVFTEIDIENIAHLQKMLLSFYDKNQLSLRNTNLKDDIVLSLIRTLELFDQYTGGHSEDVANLGKILATKLNVAKGDIYNIYWAGIVHDIGKIGVDPLIINKQGKLTLDEYEEVKLHPIHGYSVLIRSEDLKDIAVLVRHHHEWWNGQGYPDKIKQNEIPYGSQILQVADSVSSMATKRSYSDIKTMDEIKKELTLYSGTQFSPLVAKAMIDLIEEGTIEEYYKSWRK